MNKSFWLLLLILSLQFLAGCANHLHDRYPSSEDEATAEYYRHNPRLRR